MKQRPAQLASLALFDLRSLVRWSGLCALTGALAGVAAAAFVSAVQWLQLHTLDRLLGVHLETLPGVLPSESALLPRWCLPAVPALGGLLCGLLALRLGPELYGGGTDKVLNAYHRRQGQLGWRALLGKWLASAITLGTGGSAGREGPMNLVGGGIGSLTARLFRLADHERRLLLLAGAGAGVGAVFRVPLGSAIFAIEVLYRDGFEEEGIFPCLIASVTGFAVFVAFHGTGQMFTLPPFAPLALYTLPLYALVGAAVAPFGYLFAAALRLIPTLFQRLGIRRWQRPCLGGLLVGVLGLLNPELLGIGYGWVQHVLAPVGDQVASFRVAGMFLLFAFGKIVATSLTVGSGGSGGTFAPSIVAGGFVGGAVGQAIRAIAPSAVPEPASFALVGMGAFLGGIAHVPLAGVIIVCELAGNYDLLVPLMAAVGVSYILQRRTTIYPEQVQNPASSPAHAHGIAIEALGTLCVCDVAPLRPAPDPVPASMTLHDLITAMGDRRTSILPVVGEDGKTHEIVTLKTLRAILDDAGFWRHLIVADATMPLIAVRAHDSLQRVLEVLLSMDCEEVLVVDDTERPIGVVGHEDIARLTLRRAMEESGTFRARK